MAGPTGHHGIGVWAILTLAGQTGALAVMIRVLIVLFKASLAKVHGAKEASNVYNGVKMTHSFVVDQVQIKEWPVFVVVVRHPNKLVA